MTTVKRTFYIALLLIVLVSACFVIDFSRPEFTGQADCAVDDTYIAEAPLISGSEVVQRGRVQRDGNNWVIVSDFEVKESVENIITFYSEDGFCYPTENNREVCIGEALPFGNYRVIVYPSSPVQDEIVNYRLVISWDKCAEGLIER